MSQTRKFAGRKCLVLRIGGPLLEWKCNDMGGCQTCPITSTTQYRYCTVYPIDQGQNKCADLITCQIKNMNDFYTNNQIITCVVFNLAVKNQQASLQSYRCKEPSLMLICTNTWQHPKLLSQVVSQNSIDYYTTTYQEIPKPYILQFLRIFKIYIYV